MSRKEEYKEKNLLYLDEIASEQAKSLLIGKASFPYIIKER